ncbi:MAG: hypothetical protein JO301_04140 [Chitinophagaceae bacterium]|nr:hypothetical protein [Chitinophagaceae bacterium]
MLGQEWLARFYETIAEDPRISVTHISVYLAIVYEVSRTGHDGAVDVDRQNIMRLAKVNSPTTYNRSLHALRVFGYIEYVPSPGRGKSIVRLRKM